MPPEAVFELLDAQKSFGATPALRGVSLEIRPGEIYALLGPNGAGKTTALGLLTGLKRPDGGRARLFGRDPRDWRARAAIGVTPQATGFPPTLRVREIVDFARAHHEHPLALDDVVVRFGLQDVAGRQAGGLSGGQQRRLALALAFAGDPPAVVLDEPTTGLDVEARSSVWRLVGDFAARGGTALLSTHYLEEAEALASRIGILLAGVKVAEGDVEGIRAAAGLTTVRLAALPEVEVAGVVEVVRNGAGATLYTRDAAQVVKRLVELRIPLAGLEVRPASLEDAFTHLTKQ